MGKKWNQDAGPSEKLLTLYTLLLFGNRGMTLGEIAEELDCSRQSVLRLVRKLEASRFGKLLHCKRGRESVYQLDKPSTPRLSLDAEGLRQLALCRDFLAHMLPDAVRGHLNATLRQASAYSTEETDTGFCIGASQTKGSIDYTPFQDRLETLTECIRGKRVCSVRYRTSIHAEPSAFDYAPKRLVAYHESIHVHGWVVSEKGSVERRFETSTTLALQRVLEAVPTRRSSARLPEIPEDSGLFGLLAEDPFTVRIRFSPAMATYVAERTWSREQKVEHHRDGSLTLSMLARSPDEVLSWVLGFGDDAELLAPRRLREELAGQVERLCRRYGKSLPAPEEV